MRTIPLCRPLQFLLLLFVCNNALADAIRFSDQTQAAGIDYVNICGGKDKQYVLEAHGSGAAFFDSDNDGDLDLYITNGATFSTLKNQSGPGNVFYEQIETGLFQDISTSTNTAHAGWGTGIAVGDVDNNGLRDLYVSNYGANVLYAQQR